MRIIVSDIKTRFFHVVLLICLSGLSGCYGEKPDELTDCLDHAIDNKVSFIREKDRTIEEAKRMLRADSLSAEHEYDINLKLYEEYRKYILDSEVRYVERNLEIARELKILSKNISIAAATGAVILFLRPVYRLPGGSEINRSFAAPRRDAQQVLRSLHPILRPLRSGQLEQIP